MSDDISIPDVNPWPIPKPAPPWLLVSMLAVAGVVIWRALAARKPPVSDTRQPYQMR